MVYVPTTYHILPSSCHFYASSWYIVQTAKGIKGYVHKSRIKPVEERNEQKIRYYKVKNGDKIQDIAEKLGVSIDTICKLNRVKITTVLREGQALRISR